MKISIKKIINYFLIYILFIFQGSVFFKNYQDFFHIAIFLVFITQIIRRKKIRDRGYFLWIFVLLCLLLVTFFTSDGSLSISSIGNMISRYLLIYIVYNYNKEKFCDRYVLFTAFMSVVSLAFYVLQLINPDIIRIILLPCENNTVTFYGQILFTLAPDHLIKNCGAFTEPGLHEIVLNVALYILLFMESKLSLNRKQKMCSLIIILVTLVTTQSTTGYLSAIILFTVYFIHRRNGELSRFRNLIIIGIAIFVIVDLARGDKGFIYEGFIRKLFNSDGRIDVTVASGKSRYYSMIADLAIARLHPLGYGYENYLSVWRSFLTGSIRDASSTVGLTASCAVIGFPATIVTIAMYVWLLEKNYSDIYMKIAYIGMFLNVSLGQPNIRFPALMILLLINCKDKKKIVKVNKIQMTKNNRKLRFG